jgi:Ca2+-binding RTX toxin-like protein
MRTRRPEMQRRLIAIGCIIAVGIPVAPAEAAQFCFGKKVTIRATLEEASTGAKVLGTSGDDVILGTKYRDKIDPLGGKDTVCGAGGDDKLWNGPKRGDVIAGEEGVDLIISKNGGARLVGGPNDDIIQLDGFGNNNIDGGGNGVFGDTISYLPSNRRIVANLTTGVIKLGDYRDQASGIESVIGSKRGDTIYGDAEKNSLFGGPGDDLLHGLGRNDSLVGGSGNDYLEGGRGNDALDGGANPAPNLDITGNDPAVSERDGVPRATGDWAWYFDAKNDLAIDLSAGIATGAGTDSIEGVENALGGEGLNDIFGDKRKNILIGNDKHDALMGHGGDDVMIGLGGRDRIVGDIDGEPLDGQPGNDELFGNGAADSFISDGGNDDYNGGSHPINEFDSIYYGDAPNALTIDLLAGATGQGGDHFSNMESAYGSDFNDHIFGTNGPDYLSGFGGNDTIEGRGGDDFLDGGADTDSIDGGEGTDNCDDGETYVNCP